MEFIGFKTEYEIDRIVNSINKKDDLLEKRGRKREKRTSRKRFRNLSIDPKFRHSNHNKMKSKIEGARPWVLRQRYLNRVFNKLYIKNEMKIQLKTNEN